MGETNLNENPEETEETWIEVKRRKRTKDGRVPLMVSPSDKVDEVMRRIRHNVKSSEVYMMCEGRVLRWSDELRSSGVGDGCTVQIMNMMRGKHRNKKNRAEKKPTVSPKNPEPMREQQEDDEEKIIQDKSLFES